MSAIDAAPGRGGQGEGFSARTILALVIVGVVAFAGLGVLFAYAPDLRGAGDPGAHALSASAVGFKGAVVMLEAEGVPTVIARAPPRGKPTPSLLVLTPGEFDAEKDLEPFALQAKKLIVLPKWSVAPRALHLGYVDKAGLSETGARATALLNRYAKKTIVVQRAGVTRPVLRGAGGGLDPALVLPLGAVDRLQTVAGEDWEPALTDEQGRIVLARARTQSGVYLLADPDLLNNQGVFQIANARAGLAILDALRGGQGVTFDVTLNGFSRGRGILRTMLEPPWLAASLCGVAAAVLMGLHAIARFGPVRTRGRAVALGKRALVDNSAGLVRMAGREAELAPAYAALTKAMIGRLAGGGERTAAGRDNDAWLAELARLRSAAPPEQLTREADRGASRDDLLAVGRRLYFWRLEMTRERR